MKRGFLTTVAALLCVLTCAFALVACGEGSKKYVNESTDVTEYEWTEFQTKMANADDIGGNCTIRISAKGNVESLPIRLNLGLDDYDVFFKWDNANLRYQMMHVLATSNGGDYEIQSVTTYDIKGNKAYAAGQEIGAMAGEDEESQKAFFNETACFASPLIGNMSDYKIVSGGLTGRSSAKNNKAIEWTGAGIEIPAGALTLWWSNETSGFEGFTSQNVTWIEIDMGLVNGGEANENVVTVRFGDFYNTVVDVAAKPGDTFKKLFNG